MIASRDKVLKSGEIADFLAVSAETVARWCQAGRLPGFKIGGQWRVRQSDLNRIITGKIDKNFRKKGAGQGKALF
ncbi:MAG: hypothetical protein A3J48_02190 [Candidatus Doudnabacteria bacterium RIFCSPHIGHO2_02_FULL_46_11]|uniref:Helix-turn-helix domain-containing protein n=1 Tax=Candidatus Doudnabacteria bacterium RIFCSPHIGHO2_02_FULL_46_11 TaxID=1817832 RepID=A0A1F5P5I9_9BACT|nr:MAG: hypothetical protein A3J48_02190 [Candidatus Doudnabacteria bacterium RIFCSPHIGHO2_02_FULL_46_11]